MQLIKTLALSTLFAVVHAAPKPAGTTAEGAPKLEAAQARTGSSASALKAGMVIPDVVDDFKPTVELTVKYGSTTVLPGQKIDPAIATEAPSVTFKGAKKDALYTLVMTDPGVMDAKTARAPGTSAWQWLHYIVVDIPGDGSVADGKVVEPYGPPNPPAGLHRYALILFEQDKTIAPEAPTERGSWNTREFASANALEPVGGTYFTAEPAAGATPANRLRQ